MHFSLFLVNPSSFQWMKTYSCGLNQENNDIMRSFFFSLNNLYRLMSVCSREALIVRGRVSFRSIGVRLCVEMLKCFLCVEKNVIGLYNKQNAQQ